MLLAGVMALGLAACGGITSDDAEAYIQGLLDASYLGQYNQEYLDLADITEEESRTEDYEWNTAAEAEILREYLAIQSTDASIQQSVDLIKEIYAHSKYSVTGASKLEDGSYAVTVSIQPMDILVWYTSQTDLNQVWQDILTEHGVTDQAALGRHVRGGIHGPGGRLCRGCAGRHPGTGAGNGLWARAVGGAAAAAGRRHIYPGGHRLAALGRHDDRLQRAILRSVRDRPGDGGCVRMHRSFIVLCTKNSAVPKSTNSKTQQKYMQIAAPGMETAARMRYPVDRKSRRRLRHKANTTINREDGFVMAILVSGGAGYIGSHTCIELLNAGYDIVVGGQLL